MPGEGNVPIDYDHGIHLIQGNQFIKITGNIDLLQASLSQPPVSSSFLILPPSLTRETPQSESTMVPLFHFQLFLSSFGHSSCQAGSENQVLDQWLSIGFYSRGRI